MRKEGRYREFSCPTTGDQPVFENRSARADPAFRRVRPVHSRKARELPDGTDAPPCTTLCTTALVARITAEVTTPARCANVMATTHPYALAAALQNHARLSRRDAALTASTTNTSPAATA